MRKPILILLFLVLPLFAIGDDLNIREINRNADVLEDSEVEEISFYSGESVTFNARLRRGNVLVTIPSDAVPVWRAWVDGTPNTLYISATGTVVSGYAQIELTPSQSNFTAGDYKFQIGVTQSNGSFFGIAAQGDLEVKYASPSAATYVGTSDAFREVLAGSNITVTTNGNNRTVAATDSILGLTPTAGRLIYGNGSIWTVLAPGTLGQVLSMGASLPAWASAGAGDITSVVAGNGLTGGGTGGDVTLTIPTQAVDTDTHAPATVTVDARGIVTSIATTSSAALQTALGSVYLPLAGGTLTGNLFITKSNAAMLISSTNAGPSAYSIASTPSGYPSEVGRLLFNDSASEVSNAMVSGFATTATRGKLVFQTSDNAGTLATALTLDYDQSATFAGVITGNGSGLTLLDATDLVGDIPAASFGEWRMEFPSGEFQISTSAQVGYSQYTLTSGSPANAITVSGAKSANTSEQAFVWRSSPIVVPRGFVAFKTSGAIDIDWIADSTTVADIRGIRLVRYVTTTPSTLYTDSTTRNVGTINTPANVAIDRSAFALTTVNEGDHLVLEITGAIEDSMTMGLLHVCIHGE